MSDASGSPPASPRAAADPDDDVASPAVAKDDAADLSDNDSVLSDVDEAQFEDFDPSALGLEDRPIAVDHDTVKLLGRHKRQRDAGADDGEKKKKKKKEGRMERQRKQRKKERDAAGDDDEDLGSGGLAEGQDRRRRRRVEGEVKRKEPEPENEDDLDPEERRRRALDRAMDAALKNPNRRRRKNGDIDLNQSADEEIADLRVRMAEAAQADVEARNADPPQPAMHKLKLLPEVVALLNRNGREIENAIVDPDNNLLESVRFFLEPLRDGSLPAYNIQRELFAALSRLPIDKDALISSGLGKVVVFYTKAKKAEVPIKRQAERLLAEWTRPILKRSDDYRNRQLETRAYDPRDLALRARGQGASQEGLSREEAAALRRRRELAPPSQNNRARIDNTAKSYSIVPQSNVVVQQTQFARPMGATGDEAFRRMKARQMAAMGKGPRRG